MNHKLIGIYVHQRIKRHLGGGRIFVLFELVLGSQNCVKNTFLVYKSPVLSSFMKGNVCYFNLAVFLVTFQRILHRLVTKCQVQCCTSLPMISPKIVYFFCISLCNNDIILSEHVMRWIVVPFWVHFSTSGAPK